MNWLKRLFSGGAREANEPGHDERVLAVAALLVEAAVADDHYSDAEKALIERLLVSEFGVDATAVGEIRAEAERRQKEAVDLYRFIRVAKSLPPADKLRLVETLWRVILSDGEKHSWEDMLVRRVCGLLHVEDVDSGLARQRVQNEIGS